MPMIFSESTLESFRNILHCPSLQIFAHTDWGSNNPSHRELLRAEIQKHTSGTTLYHSVSHTHDLGMFALCEFPIGVDLEITLRVQDKVVARISTDEELRIAPNPSALWCAKEACFKALKTFEQPSVVSRISVGDWKKIDSQTETFALLNSTDFKSSSEGRGIVRQISQWSFCFFVIPS
ncbi:4'-phosphopantetheinyl transferase superfamily protein [Bdellovibrio bacteriovorus]|uniref:4'-phosphopantetheinyl transferase superfamily protein n=1 Tax=Bdellovibrio bacteriovorus TaxID=959 RepID=UPI0021D070F3|nr:4'-phosphopantetheinyl transferase superfamily protein [Bdellovibrio bacteriovorus]UXR65900.1 4'-phosphopantetheinyl transferase superfamily protein [Bdellovibrio bacteriovorus]